MPYRVLLVEDEEWIRKGLIKSIQWDALRLTLAGEAANGFEALSALSQQHVDIVITDMRMPACDGRMLLEKMEQAQMDCEILVISEYSDFAYMRQAIHANVFDYLLKPISNEALNTQLLRITEKLRVRSARSAKCSEPLPILLSILEDSTAWKKTDVDEIPIAAGYLETHDVYLACLQIAEPQEGAVPMVTSAFQGQLTPTDVDTYISALYGYSDMAALLLSFDPGHAGSERQMIQILKELYTHTQVALHGELRVGVLLTPLKANRLQVCLAEAVCAAQCLHYGKNAIIYYEQTQQTGFQMSVPTISDKRFSGMIETGSREDAFRIRQQLLQWITSVNYLPIPSIHKTLIDFSLTLEKCCQRVGYTVNISRELGNNYIDTIQNIQSFQAADDYLTTVIDCVFNAIDRKRILSSKEIIQQITHHLENSYAEAISLMEISERYHLNYIYLSRIFKEHTGLTFTEYLQRIRMARAKALFDEGILDTKEIATLCGYTNPYYFSTVYKKYFDKEQL